MTSRGTWECCNDARSAHYLGPRGLCVRCARDMQRRRKAWALGPALAYVQKYAVKNTAGATRLATWAVRRHAAVRQPLRGVTVVK